MREIRVNYILLVLAMLIAAVMSVIRPSGFPEPWLSMLSLGLVIVVACRVMAGGRAPPGDKYHIAIQQRVLLLFLIASVVSSFQWILLFKQAELHWLQGVAWVLYAAMWLHLAIGLMSAGRRGGGGVTASARAREPDPPPHASART